MSFAIDATTIGLSGALLLGAGSSVHCLLMCGPLGCAASGTEPEQRTQRVLAYQLGRFAGYLVLGALLGSMGRIVGKTVRVDLRGAVPWLVIGALLVSAIPAGLRPWAASSGRFAQLLRRLRAPLARLSPMARALSIGAITPLLPCGILYSLFPAAIAAQSALAGALLFGGFSLGSAPSLLFAQAPLALVPATLVRRVSRPLRSMRVLAPLGAAAVLLYRTIATAKGGSCH